MGIVKRPQPLGFRTFRALPAGNAAVFEASARSKKRRSPLFERYSRLGSPMKNSASVPSPQWEPITAPTMEMWTGIPPNLS